MSQIDDDARWNWEQNEIEKELYHLRRALCEEGRQNLPADLVCQALTNLGNVLNGVGRPAEAIEQWNRALALDPSFGMALGNRGIGFMSYAYAVYDNGHARLFFLRAHSDFTESLGLPLHQEAKRAFQERRDWIASKFPKETLDTDWFNSFGLGESDDEIRYRRWCLEEGVFLNPLNDLGPHSIAARDIITTPNMVTKISDGPYYQGFYNQIKQEYVSARYFYYEGLMAKGPQFSDGDVLLYNTLDYPSYCLAVEKVKASFRVLYSLFDKIAYFLNEYLALSIPDHKVNFRTLWYESQERRRGLRLQFQQAKNWPLRGLFWLGKDLYETRTDFTEAMLPDAQDLWHIRNCMEHKYLKLHEPMWAGPPSAEDEFARGLTDTLAFSVRREDFEKKTLRLMKLARVALIYLPLAIHAEEVEREQRRKPGLTVPAFLGIWEDRWKV